ncbi:Rab GTPase-binding effector protein 1 [Clonorchis sinensis]|uniref:Rab GTPase-binding effector protein 1 n=1 Tax=Clonorchis sinensis TaxID=79923 RepID=G7YT61_CLOSI|nr:Rab GTPase-binding effector protein 1 [Clonorchis sinensis]
MLEANCDSSATIQTTDPDLRTEFSVDQIIADETASYDWLPHFVQETLSELPNPESRYKLQSLLNDTFKTVQLHQSNYLSAQAEASELKERLKRLEIELGDVRSAAALMVDGQDDALSNLKRRYEEELASLQSISQHQLADLEAAAEKMLQRERARWAEERSALLSRFEALRGTTSPVSRRFSTPIAPPVNRSNFPVQHPLTSDNALARIPSGTSSPVEAEVNVSSPRSRLVDSSNYYGEVNSNSITENEELDLVRMGATYIKRYEDEIARLRRMLEDSVLQNYNKTPDEGDPPLSDSVQDNTTENDATPNSDSNVVLRASQTESPSFVMDEPQATLGELPNSPITEASWLRLQRRLKGTDQRPSTGCVMCSNYEHQLQILQSNQQLKDKNLRELTNELAKKSGQLAVALQNQSDLETELKSRTVTHAKRIELLESSIARFSGRLEDLMSNYRAHRLNTETDLRLLTIERETLQANMETLQSHYDALIGRRSKSATELSEQPIHLPSDKTELELLALKLYEENLSLRTAREHLDERLQSESQFNQQQLNAERAERENAENTLQRELDDTKARLASLADIVAKHDKEASARLKAEEDVESVRKQMEEIQIKLNQAESEAAELRTEVSTFQQRMICLQSDLDNAESVQADFVRLSQTLQVQLERFRQQEHELRWVDPDDVATCFACTTPFHSGSRKINCPHCGKVHCQNCMKNTVSSGPSGRLARVCDVCHTLLNKHVAPYFSTGLPDPNSNTHPGHDSSRLSRANSSNTQPQSPSSVTPRNKS